MDATQPTLLGDSILTETTRARMTNSERALVERLRAHMTAPRFWECYDKLRQDGWNHEQAAVGAWAACGRGMRGQHKTAEAFADLLGHTRHWLQRHMAPGGQLRESVDALRLTYFDERIADVDEAVYHAAISDIGTASDRKLFYQRARVPLSGEDAESADNWAELLRKAKAEADSAAEADADATHEETT